jgi:uncharacterized protein
VSIRSIDANIILRFLLADHPEHSPRCKQLLERIESGAEVVTLPEVVLSDVIWTLKSFYRWPNERIQAFAMMLLGLDGIQMTRKPLVQTAVLLFAQHNVDFSDALVVAEMQWNQRPEIYSYDRDFQRVSGIVRIEP